MKKIVLAAIITLCVCCSSIVDAQVIFSESFGQTTVRQTSPYMPTASFGWADPNGIPNEKMVENNYYAVIAPANIRDAWPIPAWWFWTGPEPVGNTWGGAGNPATADHTGDANGAVMAVNAGSTLSGFYSRLANLVPGQCYRLSMWFYLVNTSSTISLELRDPLNNSVLGSYTTPFLSTEDSWQQFSFDFILPVSCTNGGQVRVNLANAYSSFGGNDYYVDDIILETISCAGASSIGCPSGSLLALNRVMLTAATNSKGVSLSWRADDESDATVYRLQKSTDGINFETIYKLNVTPGATQEHMYTDATTVQAQRSYYRIAAIKKSGVVVYSSTVSIASLKSANSVLVYPQPARSTEPVYIKINEPLAASLVLYNITGAKLKTFNCYPGQTLTVSGLKPGQYVLRVIDKAGIAGSVTKLVVE